MHMIAIGWLWVAFMMAITEKSLVAGVLTFLFYGLFPCAVLLYLLNKQAGRRRRHAQYVRQQETAKTNSAPADPAAAPDNTVDRETSN